MRFASSRSPTDVNCRCTATGCSDPCRTPRTPCRTRCLLPGKASAGSSNEPRSAPGCTGSPPTSASTRGGQPADAAAEWDVPHVEPPEPTRLGEVVWLEPYPDALLGGAAESPRPRGPLRTGRNDLAGLPDRTAGPAAPPARRSGLARRPRLPRQRGGRHARLDVESVNSALKRARSGLERGRTPNAAHAPPVGSASEEAVVTKFVQAWESADLQALVGLLTDDVFVSMPPMPFEYEGRDLVARFCASILAWVADSTW